MTLLALIPRDPKWWGVFMSHLAVLAVVSSVGLWTLETFVSADTLRLLVAAFVAFRVADAVIDPADYSGGTDE